MKAYPRLLSEWWSGKDFLNQSSSIDGNLSFFVKIPANNTSFKYLSSGQLVLVTIRFLDKGEEQTLHARILRKAEHEAVGVQLLLLGEEKEQQQHLIWCAAGSAAVHKQRRSERIPCFFPVAIAAGDAPAVPCWALNISQHGIYVTYQGAASHDQVLQLAISFPDTSRPFEIKGRVKSIVLEAAQPGVGLSFLFESGPQHADLVAHVNALKGLYGGQRHYELLDDSVELNLPTDFSDPSV